MAGPDSAAISRRWAQLMPRGRRRGLGGNDAGSAPPPPVARFTGKRSGELSRVRSVIGSLLLPCSGVVDRLDDACGVTTAGEHLDDTRVQRVAHVLPVHRVEPCLLYTSDAADDLL